MFRKIVCILSMAGVLAANCVCVQAGGNCGTIRIIPTWAGKPIISGQISLCRIGEPDSGDYKITDGLANWIMNRQDVQTESFLQWAVRHFREEGTVRSILDEEGAVFGDLQEGLYLIIQKQPAQGYSGFSPFVFALPADGKMEVKLSPQVFSLEELPQTGDYPAPIFAAMLLSFAVVIFMVIAENRKK